MIVSMREISALLAKLNQGLMSLIISSLFLANTAYSVTQHKQNKIPYTKSLATFKSSLVLESVAKETNLPIPKSKILKRLKHSTKDERVEKVFLNLSKDDDTLMNLSFDLSRKGKTKKLFNHFKKLQKSKDAEEHPKHIRAPLSHDSLKYVDLTKLSALYKRSHQDVKVLSGQLRKSKKLRQNLYSQLRPFLTEKEMKKLKIKIRNNIPLDLEKDLLSGFSKKMVGDYTVFRGPNCFHAALAFHSSKLTESPFLNVKKEKGYHRAMINYDELWRTINRHFYEVDPRKSSLRYGDLMVFMDVPNDDQAPYFKWIRHAATYLFGNYTFSKGSKSSNTPYSIKTLEEEWRTWQGYSKNLRVKVFRRAQNRVNKRPPVDLIDWIY